MSEQIRNVYWMTHRREIAGNFSYTINSRDNTMEYVVAGEDNLRVHLEAITRSHQLINLAPDIAVNPHAVDALICTREKISILFSDETELSSSDKFHGVHEQILKLRLKSLIESGRGGRRDWLLAEDNYQIVLVRKAAVKRIYRENSHVMFELGKDRPHYLTDWDSTQKAEEYLAKFQAQFV